MVDVKAREKQLRERLAELEGRLHRIEDHLGEPPDKDWEDNAIESEMDELTREIARLRNPADYGEADTAGDWVGSTEIVTEAITKERVDIAKRRDTHAEEISPFRGIDHLIQQIRIEAILQANVHGQRTGQMCGIEILRPARERGRSIAAPKRPVGARDG